MTRSRRPGRRAGLVVPLFSMASRSGWGIGELTDLPRIAPWLGRSGMSVLQILPISESVPAAQSPYSGLSSMAIDPQYISLSRLVDFTRAGGEAGLDRARAECLTEARRSPAVRYDLVRSLKRDALQEAFASFHQQEWTRGTRRAGALRAYIRRESWWLDDYALFRALHQEREGRPWHVWETPLARRDPDALRAARQSLARAILFQQYVQWIAETQWQRARRNTPGVAIFGDFPFMVAGDSADVWLHQDQFHLDRSIGTPPDAFSETGQNWGLPAYRWESHLGAHLSWLARRARRAAALFDGLRIDHVVGYYRTYVIGHDGRRGFVPADESSQRAQGAAVMEVLLGSGAELTAEDLGTIPAFVRESLGGLRVPGYRVFRWERAWHDERQPFIDPAGFPPLSVATTGTHDIEPLAVWWDELNRADRLMLSQMESLRLAAPLSDLVTSPFDDRLRDAFLALLYGAGSDLLLLPVQDVFGWRERINVPATTTADNWTYRLPWSLEQFGTEPVAQERARFLAELAVRTGRSPEGQ